MIGEWGSGPDGDSNDYQFRRYEERRKKQREELARQVQKAEQDIGASEVRKRREMHRAGACRGCWYDGICVHPPADSACAAGLGEVRKRE